MSSIDRRKFLELMALSASSLALSSFPFSAQADKAKVITKKIPSTGVLLPIIGMGTWITFNVGENLRLREARTQVLREFFSRGGGMIDSSPMYGSSEEVIGFGLKKLDFPKSLFSATKIWTSSETEGLKQIEDSKRLWGLKKFDLLQVHNLDGWEAHLKTLFKMKEKGELRHVGVTTSHGRRHDDLEKIMRTRPLDFIQLTYNMEDLRAEKLMDLAQERGIAVIANRPFDGGDLFRRVQGKPLPPWAAEINCQNWAQFLLKFVVSHPAVTCAIPATSKVEHMQENMGANSGKLPDANTRQKMLKAIASL